jgi:peptide/nickel transport system ATP-binding protein
MVPSLGQFPAGCRFQDRCQYRQDLCTKSQPELRKMAADASVACHFAGDLKP